MVSFARSLETTLSLKIAEAKAPGAPSVVTVPPPAGQPTSGNSAAAPGG